jgi:hypothetical protein
MNPIQLAYPVIANVPFNPATKAVKFTELKLRQSVDSPVKKTVSVYFVGANQPLVIWSGAAYDSIGNWTQEQLDAEVSSKVAADPLAIVKEITGAVSIVPSPVSAPIPVTEAVLEPSIKP